MNGFEYFEDRGISVLTNDGLHILDARSRAPFKDQHGQYMTYGGIEIIMAGTKDTPIRIYFNRPLSQKEQRKILTWMTLSEYI